MIYDEGHGMFTISCRDEAVARAAMVRELREAGIDQHGRFYPPEKLLPDVNIDIAKIKEDRIFFCEHCSYYTVGECMCGECGKQLGQRGRRTYVYNF